MATETVKTLTPEEVSAAQAQGDAIADSGTQAASGDTFVFFAGFDGTNNIKDNPAYSHDPQSTAVGALSDQVEKGSVGNNNVLAKYYPGVGTPGTRIEMKIAEDRKFGSRTEVIEGRL